MLRVDTMFESVARPNLIKRRYGAGAVVSILTHAGTLAVVAWLTRYVPVKSTTEVTVAFVRPVVPPPPPPPPAPAAAKPVRTKPTTVKPRPTLPQAIVAPKVIPEEKPPEKPPEEAPPEEEEEGVEGGVPGGVIGGVQGGIVGQPLPPPTNVRMEFNDTMTPPAMISGPTIQYTDKALEREVQGLMIVKCVVTVDGVVRECRVVQSLPFMDRAVIDALERRHYKPALLQGRPIEVDYTFKIRLNLPQ
jgi:periplasmic protein TonB